jgi:opacity protein-like surface antigen
MSISAQEKQGKCDNKWRFELIPLYLWASGIEGNVSVRNYSTPVDVSFADLIENFDFGYMGHFEAGYNEWVFFTDILYMDLGAETNGYEFDMKEIMLEGGAGYTVGQGVELLAGFRYFNMKLSLIKGSIAVENSQGWLDPFVGARFMYIFPKSNFSVGLRGDMGGFGLGSKFAYNFVTTVNYQISRLVRVSLGYRYYNFDYKADNEADFKFDATMHGPGLGVNFSL